MDCHPYFSPHKWMMNRLSSRGDSRAYWVVAQLRTGHIVSSTCFVHLACASLFVGAYVIQAQLRLSKVKWITTAYVNEMLVSLHCYPTSFWSAHPFKLSSSVCQFVGTWQHWNCTQSAVHWYQCGYGFVCVCVCLVWCSYFVGMRTVRTTFTGISHWYLCSEGLTSLSPSRTNLSNPTGILTTYNIVSSKNEIGGFSEVWSCLSCTSGFVEGDWTRSDVP